MQEKDIIKSLVKSIKVLELIQNMNGCSLNQLYHATSIPKPTLIRILNTLEHCHAVRRNIIDNQYRSNFIFSNDTLNHRINGLLTAVSGKVLDHLCARLTWPSDLLIRNGLFMEVVETTRKISPLSVNRNRVGDKVDILISAVGRAYISFCSDDERTRLLNDLLVSDDYQYVKLKNGRWLERLINETRTLGYGVRDEMFKGSHKDQMPKSDGLSAIAVPVYVKGSVVGCINMLWPSRLYSSEAFAKIHLDELKSASVDISTQVETLLNEINGSSEA